MDTSRPRPPLPVPFFYGWVVVALTFLAILCGSGVRSALAALMHPLEAEFGWSRTSISSAAAINLFLYGAAAPFSGWLFDRFGPRRVTFGALSVIGLGALGAGLSNQLWQFVLFWGIVVGFGTGGLASVLAASVAYRWFEQHRGLALGILNSAGSTGQLIFIPALMSLIVTIGWRSSLYWFTAVCFLLALLVALWMRDSPSELGLKLYGAGRKEISALGPPAPTPSKSQDIASISVLGAVTNPNFWLLSGSFMVCGGTANGLIGTHLIPHAIDRGIPEIDAAYTVGVMGAMNFVGTMLSGYLTDRIDPRKVLASVFALRGLALFILPYMNDFRGLFVFAVIYGLDWFATVPPTIMLTGRIFGKHAIGKIYGWIFLSHQVGGSLAALGAGNIVAWYGDYHLAFTIGGVATLVASVLGLMVRPHRNQSAAPSQPQ